MVRQGRVKEFREGTHLLALQCLELSSIDSVHISISAKQLSGLHTILLGQGARALLQQLLNGMCAVACPDVIQHAHELRVALPEHLNEHVDLISLLDWHVMLCCTCFLQSGAIACSMPHAMHPSMYCPL